MREGPFGRGDDTAPTLSRRTFMGGLAAGAGLAALGPARLAAALDAGAAPYTGPNVIVVRFGGGVRRRETIDPDHTFAPFLRHELAARGTLFTRMELTSELAQTNHGPGTLNILTGTYARYEDVERKPLRGRFEAQAPTLFEYLRKAYAVPPHRTLIVNGEDRLDEEFYSFSNHHLYGIAYRSNVLSLYRFKVHLLREQIARGGLPDAELAAKRTELAKMESLDYRVTEPPAQSPEMHRFWEGWRAHYGESGLVNPRGDRVLTALAVRALRELRPALMMVNYQDCDYVHWGNPSHYTRGIAIIDNGLQRIVEAAGADPAYRGNTVFVVVPDCGRDTNPMVAIPYQHHFGDRSAHEVFALFAGPGIARGAVVDRPTDQIAVAPTVGRIMGVDTAFAQGPVLAEAFA